VPIAKWRSYFQWQIVHRTAKGLGKALVAEDFKLEQALTGQKEQRPRWKRCIDFTDDVLGELLAQPFVELRFGGKSKQAAEALIAAIGRAFEQDVAQLGWMDSKTVAAARDKSAAMAFLIGYPEKWKTYDFEVKAGDFAANAMRGRAFDQARKLARIGKPVNRGEWEMTPPTVNAYYNPLKNQMVFPAGILQPPFYDVKANTAVNLGAMGMVVGHELTHGFDDEGSQFDKAGNMREWWPAAVKSRFKAQTQCVATQYSRYEAVPGMKLNGDLTLGENIADMGGVKLAFHAYRQLTKGTPELVADGYGEDQQFFLSIGQIWCSKQHDEWARMAASIDPHSPAKWRVNGSLSNLPEFSKAFSCGAGSKMNPEKKCSVW
jgi:putative endopeptidase